MQYESEFSNTPSYMFPAQLKNFVFSAVNSESADSEAEKVHVVIPEVRGLNSL